MDKAFSRLSDEDTRRLSSQRAAISQLTEQEYGARLTQSVQDLALIQGLIDDDVIDHERYPLQCLGVALGDVLARSIPGLNWWIVDDEYGRDPCLRFRDSTLHVNPLTMISKRLERGESVSVRDLYEGTAAFVRDRGDEFLHTVS